MTFVVIITTKPSYIDTIRYITDRASRAAAITGVTSSCITIHLDNTWITPGYTWIGVDKTLSESESRSKAISNKYRL